MSRTDREILVDGATPLTENNSFRHITLRYDRDSVEPEKYVETCYVGEVSYYNRNKGYGFVQRDRESYFFHVRGFCKLNPVFYRNEHKILLVVGAKLDNNNLPASGRKLRFILKETDQGTQARLWCFEEDYQAKYNELDIRGNVQYRCTMFRDVLDAAGVAVAKDSIVVFEGNNLDKLHQKLDLIREDAEVEGTEVLFEAFVDDTWQVCDCPVNMDYSCQATASQVS